MFANPQNPSIILSCLTDAWISSTDLVIVPGRTFRITGGLVIVLALARSHLFNPLRQMPRVRFGTLVNAESFNIALPLEPILLGRSIFLRERSFSAIAFSPSWINQGFLSRQSSR